MDENGTDQALRRRAAQLTEAIDGDGPGRPPLAEVLADTPARRPVDRGVRTALAPGLAAAGIVVVALAIVLSGFTRGPVVPVASSPVASSQPPTSSPTAATATSTATATPPLDSRALVITRAPSLVAVRWAPDGKTFALLDESGFADHAVIHFFSREGGSLGDVSGRDLAWIDAERYVVLQWPDPTEQIQGRAFIGQVGRTALTQIPGTYGEGPIGSGRGEIALPLANSSEYVLWSNGQLSQPRAGRPVAWSNDGQKLAVLHVNAKTLRAWPEVVGLSGARLAAAESLDCSVIGLAVVFSPDGLDVAISDCVAGAGTLPFILSLATSKPLSLGDRPVNSMAWANDQRLYTVSSDPGSSLTEWGIDGQAVAIASQTADGVSVSSTGIVAVTQGSTNSIAFLDSPSEPIRLAASQFVAPVWSPVGTVAVVICYLPDDSTEAFLITP